MRKRALAVWPLWLPKEAEAAEANAKAVENLWVQEEEVLKNELLREPERAQEKIQKLLPLGIDLKRLVL